MQVALSALSFERASAPVAEVVSMAVNAQEGAPVVRNASHDASEGKRSAMIPQAFHVFGTNGPSRIRTWNQSVMSRQL